MLLEGGVARLESLTVGTRGAGVRFPIAPADVNRALDFIEALGSAIHGAM